MLPGARLLCCLLLPLLPRGHGSAEYGDLEDEGHYLYLDEDGPLEVLGGPALCQDTYQDWISLYCWAPFHATLMTIHEDSRCHWDQISSTYSELSSCTQLLAQLLSCTWPSAVLDTFFLHIHAKYFANCTGARPPRLGRVSPGLAVAVAVGLSCLVPLAAALMLSRVRKGLKPRRAAAQPLPAPVPVRGWQQPPSLPALGTNKWDEWAEGEGTGQSRAFGHP